MSDQKQRLLPRLLPIGSVGYHVFLASIAILILGPLGGVTAAYMNYARWASSSAARCSPEFSARR